MATQSVFQVIPKVLVEVEVRALCRTKHFFNDLGNCHDKIGNCLTKLLIQSWKHTTVCCNINSVL